MRPDGAYAGRTLLYRCPEFSIYVDLYVRIDGDGPFDELSDLSEFIQSIRYAPPGEAYPPKANPP